MTGIDQFYVEELCILNMEFRRADKAALLQTLKEDLEKAEGIEMAAVIGGLIEKIEKMSKSEVRKLFLQLPVEPFFGGSIFEES